MAYKFYDVTTPFLSLPENTKGRDFFVGDIHGAFSLLDKAMAEVKFDPACDRLISIGDLIDRGPEPVRCLEFLKQPWFFAIRGNHEDMFLRTITPDGFIDPKCWADQKYFDNLVKNGWGWVLDQTYETLGEIHKAFSKLPLALEVDTKQGKMGFAHADVPGVMGWEKFKKRLEEGKSKVIFTCLWGRHRVTKKSERGIKDIARVYFGHTPQTNGAKKLGNCYYIDTGAVFSLDPKVKEHFCLTLGEVTADPQDITRTHKQQVYTVTANTQASPPAPPAARNIPRP